MSGVLLRAGGSTHVGRLRNINQDSFVLLPDRNLWVVADGMGGHQNGALASRLIVEQLAELAQGSLEQRLVALRQALHRLNHRLGQELTVTAERPDTVIGSTVVALLLDGDRAACVWAGDSRCYLWRGARLYQLSRDHSLVQQLIDEQGLTPQEAARHPAAHALTRAIGASETLQLDILELDVLPGDVFLLCSDGLYQGVSADELGACLNLPSPHLAVERLFQRVLAGPARDNLSAVVIRQ
jgi:serine/threonine-protein phosphatase Stp1